MKNFIHKIPENYQGKPVDLMEMLEADNLEEALKCYERAKKRLLNPPVWHIIAGSLSADFKIENPGNHQPERLLEEGDFMEVNIHSPDTLVGGNKDWVQIKEITEEKFAAKEAYFLLRLEVAPNPNKNNKNIDHFLKEGASSTFIISLKDNTVLAYYFGRNESPNTNEENSVLENVRNEVVAFGALAGLSNLQWKALLKGLLGPEL